MNLKNFISLFILILINSIESTINLKKNATSFSFKSKVNSPPPTTTSTAVTSNKTQFLNELSKVGREKFSDLARKLDPYNQQANFIPEKKQHSQIHNSTTRGINHIKYLYKNEESLLNSDINTLRYIPSVRSTSYKKLTFQFNLSALTTTERLVKAELYINKKFIRHRLKFTLKYFLNRRTQPLKNKSYQEPYHTQSVTMIDLENFRSGNVRLKRNPWQMFNIIDSLSSFAMVRSSRSKKKFLQDNGNKTVYYTINNRMEKADDSLDVDQIDDFLLSMEAYVPSRSKKSLLNKKSEQINDLINPYLIMSTQEDNNLMKTFFQNRLPKALIPVLEAVLQPDYKKTTKTSSSFLSDEEFQRLKSFEDEVDKMNELTHDQEIPVLASVYSSHKDIKLFEPTSTQNKYQELGFFLDNDDHAQVKKWDDTKKTKRGLDFDDDDEKNRLLPVSHWEFDLTENKKKTSQVDQNACKAKSVTIDFKDLSFSDWILEPKSFQSNYCSGICKFSVNEKIDFSNYATLQSILSYVNFNNEKEPSKNSELCCTPSKLEPVSILFLDTNLIDYVVKVLPDMVVKECSCR